MVFAKVDSFLDDLNKERSLRKVVKKKWTKEKKKWKMPKHRKATSKDLFSPNVKF